MSSSDDDMPLARGVVVANGMCVTHLSCLRFTVEQRSTSTPPHLFSPFPPLLSSSLPPTHRPPLPPPPQSLLQALHPAPSPPPGLFLLPFLFASTRTPFVADPCNECPFQGRHHLRPAVKPKVRSFQPKSQRRPIVKPTENTTEWARLRESQSTASPYGKANSTVPTDREESRSGKAGNRQSMMRAAKVGAMHHWLASLCFLLFFFLLFSFFFFFFFLFFSLLSSFFLSS